jgi:cytochrome c-type biogenesis protein CcmH
VRRLLPWLCLVPLVAAALVAIALRGPAHAPTTADQVHTIAAGLRCPVCRDLSVADSPAPLAQQMRDTIAKDLKAGRTADQIRAEFVASYGESVLLSPPRDGIGLVAWLAPALLVAAGVGVAVAAVRRWRQEPPSPAGPAGREAEARIGAADRRRLDRALDRLDEEDWP